jgi:flagellar protein FlaG
VESITSQIGQSFAVSTVNNFGNKGNSQADQSPLPATAVQQVESLPNSSAAVEQQNTVASEVKRFTESSSDTQESTQTADNEVSEKGFDNLGLESATREVEQFIQSQNRNLTFSVDESTERSVVTVTDSGSGDVIRQIPSEEVLRLAERLNELRTDLGSSVGILFDNQV